MQRSSYPGQRDGEKERIESLSLLVAGILRRVLGIEGQAQNQGAENTLRKNEDTPDSNGEQDENR